MSIPIEYHPIYQALCAERDTLKWAVNKQTDLYRGALVEIEKSNNEVKCKVEVIHGYAQEIDRLKAELGVRSNDPLIDNHMDYLQQQCDLWKSNYNTEKYAAEKYMKDWLTEKSKAEKLAEALRKMLSPEMDWENGEIGVGSNFRRVAKAALAEYGDSKPSTINYQQQADRKIVDQAIAEGK